MDIGRVFNFLFLMLIVLLKCLIEKYLYIVKNMKINIEWLIINYDVFLMLKDIFYVNYEK